MRIVLREYREMRMERGGSREGSFGFIGHIHAWKVQRRDEAAAGSPGGMLVIEVAAQPGRPAGPRQT